MSATFIGEHRFDASLPDFSQRGVETLLATMRSALAESAVAEAESPTEALDLRLARGYLKTQIWEFESQHFHRGNPSLYCGEALFGILSLYLTEYAPLAERAEAAEARLRAIPRLLEEGRANVRRTPRPWTERALRECRGALLFLEEGIESLPRTKLALASAASGAARAFKTWQDALEQLPDSAEVACGEEALRLYLEEGHFLQESPREIAAYAEDELAAAKAALAAHARDFGAATPEEALGRLQSLHATPEAYAGQFAEVWALAREAGRDLVTWPESPIRFTPLPGWARAVAPHVYFLPYRSPSAWGRPPVHDVWIPPLEESLSAAEKERLLCANNDSVVKLNYVVHHGGLGHHVQNARASSCPSRIGRVAGIDCASRIAFFSGGTMAEGWACYATDLMSEAGFLTPLERYAETRTRARMCARAVADVRLHLGEWTLEETALHYVREAGMSSEAALAEAVKNSMFPGAALMYVMGRDAIQRLRLELSSRPGFTLRGFHDELLSYGSVPVALVAEMMRSADAH